MTTAPSFRARHAAAAIAGALLGLLALAAGPAHAQTYSGGATITVSDGTVAPGQPVTATATGFAPDSGVDFTLFSDPVSLGTATADADGVATLTFTMPDVAPGEHQLVASGVGPDGAPLQVATTITVLASADAAADLGGTGQPSGSELARTGSDVDDALRFGAILLAVGGAILLGVRKRSQRPTQAVG
jgi:hypothetical protein